ncbi:hypothetical protein F5B22DRAFT_615754 [Xylaria bambusicola]|uniref:uncharacterized protein n=1 Tax=Xylaria bambusicola TaxID=326684 RepID=UPI002007CDB2|nr:uncharacterized protein F5B22DRAFT_615754 [Xylaria bambusicola]KAI0509726.1 hypothetical protein F5B22DRAFT_615754 [Xylaria bambusicola]
MEASAPKRRKTSPTTSVPVNESNEPSSSDSATRRSLRLSRPSFASPTKASLARSNPEILQRRRSSQPNEELEAPAASAPGSPTSDDGSVTDQVTAQLEHESETGRLQHDEGVENESATVERQPQSPVRTTAGSLFMRPRRTPNKPSPRALPPPSAEEEELIDPFKGRRLRRSPPPGVLPEVLPEEPQLPPTPTQKGLSDPSSIITSPPGIHNSPSKRPRRSKVLAAKMMSSPLKQPPLRPPEFTTDVAEESVLSRLTKEGLRSEPRRKRGKRKSHPGRQVEEADPLADKKALRDSLLAEIAQLEDDLKVVSAENERLYTAQGSRRHEIDLLPGVEERDRLLDVLSRHALPPEKEEPPDPMQDWLEAAMNPIAFLPFGGGGSVLPPPLITPDSTNDTGDKEAPLPVSHHPVPMTADEELPYLQVFTPLTFTSTTTTVQPEGRDDQQQPLQQYHAISVASSPPGLFLASIDMIVDTKTLSVSGLSVPRLDPSAVAELGPFIHNITHPRAGINSALTRNIGVVSWAMGEWVRIATRRARFWCDVERQLGSSEARMRCAKMMREGVRKKARGRPRKDVDEDDDEGSGSGDEGDGGGRDKDGPSKAEVIARMGRTCFDLRLSSDDDDDGYGEEGSLAARIEWRVEFDWTGEARSKIGLAMRAPAKWRASDTKHSLAGLSDMFAKLLRDGRDPLEALKIVVALVVGDGGL